MLREGKLSLKDLPSDVEEYRRWRYAAMAAYVFNAADPSAATAFLEVVSDQRVSFEELVTERPPSQARADAGLFVAILQSLKGPDAQKFHIAIETEAEMGCGRQALRILDRSMTVSAERLALTSLQELQALNRCQCPHGDRTHDRLMLLKLALAHSC